MPTEIAQTCPGIHPVNGSSRQKSGQSEGCLAQISYASVPGVPVPDDNAPIELSVNSDREVLEI